MINFCQCFNGPYFHRFATVHFFDWSAFPFRRIVIWIDPIFVIYGNKDRLFWEHYLLFWLPPSMEHSSLPPIGFITRLGCTSPLWWCIGNWWCMAITPACSDITIETILTVTIVTTPKQYYRNHYGKLFSKGTFPSLSNQCQSLHTLSLDTDAFLLI